MKSSALKKSDSARTQAHTPGPWVVESTDDTHFILSESDSTQVAALDAVGPLSSTMPNACLIACAPEMLAMLYEINDMIEGGSPEIEALIKKAGGTFE